MRFCRYQYKNVVRYGLIEQGNGGEVIARALETMPTSVFDFRGGETVDLPLASVTLMAPVSPSKIVCIGRNYREHAKELNHAIPTEPLIFLKPPSAVLAPGGTIVRPVSLSQRVDHEGELGVVIGKRCRGVREGDDVREFILGYTCVNDVTAAEVLNENGDYFWADRGNWRTIKQVAMVRSGFSGARTFPALTRVLAFPFTLLYLVLYAAWVHTRRRLRLLHS